MMMMMMMMMMSHGCLMKHMKIFRAWLRPFADSEMEGGAFHSEDLDVRH